ncbi:MAG: hypothetical protein QN189_00190 [Armatimonadota bacterium]|nr:hypothetical protein [Armatimonadota bacterium]
MKGPLFFPLVFLLLTAPAGGATSGEVLVEFNRAGGIAGIHEQLRVYVDGSVRLERWFGPTGRESFCARLERAQLEGLQRALEAAGFDHLKAEYLPNYPVYDGFTYWITYRGYTVRTQDPLEGTIPESLHSVISLLLKVSWDVLEQKRSCPQGIYLGR